MSSPRVIFVNRVYRPSEAAGAPPAAATAQAGSEGSVFARLPALRDLRRRALRSQPTHCIRL